MFDYSCYFKLLFLDSEQNSGCVNKKWKFQKASCNIYSWIDLIKNHFPRNLSPNCFTKKKLLPSKKVTQSDTSGLEPGAICYGVAGFFFIVVKWGL